MKSKNLFILMLTLTTLSVGSKLEAQQVLERYVSPGSAQNGTSWNQTMGSLYSALNYQIPAGTTKLIIYVKEGEYSENMQNTGNMDFGPSNMPDGIDVEIYGGFDASMTEPVTWINGEPCGYDPENNPTILKDDPDDNDKGETWFRVDQDDANITVKGFHIINPKNDGSIGSIANIQYTDGKTYIFEDLYIEGGETSAVNDGQFSFDQVDNATIFFNNIYANSNVDGNALVRIATSTTGNSLTFTNSTVTGYESDVNGTAIQVEGETNGAANTVLVENSIFCNNTTSGLSTTNGGVFYFDNKVEATLNGNTFYSNDTPGDGGAIYALNQTTLITNGNTFESNIAENGGAVYTNESKWTSTNDKFIKNNARNDGGAVDIVDNYDGVNGLGDEDFKFIGAMFYKNLADSDGGNVGHGGAIWTGAIGRNLKVENSKFLENRSSEHGGAIKTYADAQILGCYFSENIAKNYYVNDPSGSGGAIYSQNAGLYVVNSCFDANITADGGGAIYVEDNGNMNEYFAVAPLGINPINNATLLRHINYNNSFTNNITGIDTNLGDDAVGGAVVYQGVRNQNSSTFPEGNIAVVDSKFFNNVLWSDESYEPAAGLALRGTANGTSGDCIVAFQNNSFAGNTRAESGNAQSLSVTRVDVSIQVIGNAAIANTGGTKFQLAPTVENYPIFQRPGFTSDWEGIDTPIYIDSGDGISGLSDIRSVSVNLNTVQTVSNNTALNTIIVNNMPYEHGIADILTIQNGNNNGEWDFLGFRSATTDKLYEVSGVRTGSPNTYNFDFTVPQWTQAAVTFNNTDTSGAMNCSITAPSELQSCPTPAQTGILGGKSAPCDCIAEPSNAQAGDTFVGISTLDRNVDGWLPKKLSAYIALESSEKGFIITRNANPNSNIGTPKEGMLVWDTTDKCLKMYFDKDDNGNAWHCITDACKP